MLKTIKERVKNFIALHYAIVLAVAFGVACDAASNTLQHFRVGIGTFLNGHKRKASYVAFWSQRNVARQKYVEKAR